MHRASKNNFQYHALTPDRWGDLESLFGEPGACGGCWCMWWRLKRSEFEKQKGDENKAAFKAVVNSGDAPGVLAYAGGRPIGWCAVAPRETYSALERSRVLKRLDDKPVWSILCFNIRVGYRRRGVAAALLDGVVDFARRSGAPGVEAYPIDPEGGRVDVSFGYVGLTPMFEKVGFRRVLETAAHSDRRPRWLMRLDFDGTRPLRS